MLVRSLGALQPEVAAWAFLDEDGSLTDESLALSRQAYVDAVVAASAGRPRKDRLETAQIDFLALIHDAAAKDPALRPQPSREALVRPPSVRTLPSPP